jgi:glycosyltransferase involved in cell wall biosynthesis
MIIELYGMSGVGKSTLAREIERNTDWQIIKIDNLFQLFWYNLLFSLTHPIKFISLLFLIIRNSPTLELFYLKFMNPLLHSNAKYQKALSCTKAIIDQGYLQNIISIFEKEISKKDILKYLKMIKKSDLYLILDLNNKDRLNRLENRGYGTRENFSKKYRDKWLSVIEKNNDAFRNILNKTNLNAHILDSSLLPENLLQEITKIIEEKKISYIINYRMPTEKAHGYQVVKTIEALTNKLDYIELIYPTRKNPNKENIFKYYGLKKSFPVKQIKSIDFIRFSHRIGSIALWLQSIYFLLKLSFLQISKQNTVYTRNPEIAWFFKLRKYRTVFEAHNWPRSKSGLLKFFLRNVDLIVCNSSGTAQKFRQEGLIKTIVANNGVDLEDFNIDKNTEEMRKELDLPIDKKIVLYLGSFYEWKGIETVLESAKIMQNKKDLLFLLIGGSEKGIEKIKDKYDLTNVMLFKHQSKIVVPKYLLSADILLLPNIAVSKESKLYTSPIKMFEYLASKKPIIASDLPSIREILSKNNAFLFESGNAFDLSKKIEYIISNPEQINSTVKTGYETAKQNTWQKKAEKITLALFN